MSEVVIRVNRFTVERIIYWVIIIILAGMLIFSYLGDQETTNQETTTQTTMQEEELEVQEELEEAINETINENSQEVEPEIIVEETTQEEVQSLSGSVELDITNVEIEEATSGALRVTEFEITINNGLQENIIPQVRAFAENLNGVLIRQLNSEEPVAYIDLQNLLPVGSGEETLFTIEQNGPYLFDDPIDSGMYYRVGNDFMLVVEVVVSGEVVATSSYRVRG